MMMYLIRARANAHTVEAQGYSAIQDVKVAKSYVIETHESLTEKHLKQLAEETFANPVVRRLTLFASWSD